MRAIAICSVFGGLIGCAADGGPDAPPTLEITSPARGTTLQGDSVEVSGVVTDDHGAKKVKVVINQTEDTPAADGTFTATVPVSAGITVLETHAIDGGANDVRDVRAVMAGELATSDGTKAAPVGARVGAPAFAALGGAMGQTIKGLDFTALAQTMNPVYDNGGCLGAKIDITSLTISDAGVALVPKAGALDTLASSTSGSLHEDAVQLGTVFRAMRDGMLGALGLDEVAASAAAGLAELQVPATQSAATHVDTVRSASCS